MAIRQYFAFSIKWNRLSRQLSQMETALKSGINYRQYQQIEGRACNIRIDTFTKMASKLGLNPVCLLLEPLISSGKFEEKRGGYWPQPEASFTLNYDGEIIGASGETEPMFGLTKDSMISKSFLTFFHESERAYFEKYFEFLKEMRPPNRPQLLNLSHASGKHVLARIEFHPNWENKTFSVEIINLCVCEC